MIIPLSKPFQYEDTELTEIDLDLMNAPGNTLFIADRRLARLKHIPPFKQMDSTYCALIASIVTKIPYEVLSKLPLPDLNLIISAVSGFLLNSEEAGGETTETDETSPTASVES